MGFETKGPGGMNPPGPFGTIALPQSPIPNPQSLELQARRNLDTPRGEVRPRRVECRCVDAGLIVVARLFVEHVEQVDRHLRVVAR